jgi:hypothetical protein
VKLLLLPTVAGWAAVRRRISTRGGPTLAQPSLLAGAALRLLLLHDPTVRPVVSDEPGRQHGPHPGQGADAGRVREAADGRPRLAVEPRPAADPDRVLPAQVGLDLRRVGQVVGQGAVDLLQTQRRVLLADRLRRVARLERATTESSVTRLRPTRSTPCSSVRTYAAAGASLMSLGALPSTPRTGTPVQV